MDPKIEPNETETKVTQEAEKVVKELRFNLPGHDLPLAIQLIAAFMLIGGLSIIGSTFADIINPIPVSLSFYVLRILIGLSSIAIAYGIVKKQRWSLWLYGFVIFIALLANTLLAIIPAAILAYLYQHRSLFNPGILDEYSTKLFYRNKSGGTNNSPPEDQV
ncbi:MAG: hypothetical protein Q8O87_01060 [bacterium]|nr:hypothetical protein [bacterium]